MILPLRLVCLADALADLEKHVHEVGTNWGPEVGAMLKLAGVNGPAPWCDAAVYKWVYSGCQRAKVANPLAGEPYKASVQESVNYAKKHGLLIEGKYALPGDQVCFDFTGRGHFDHTGLLMTSVSPASTASSVEGNTNDDGARDGYEVAKRDRHHIAGRTVYIAYDREISQIEGDFSAEIRLLSKYGINH